MTWQPRQLWFFTIRRPRSIAASSGESCLRAVSDAFNSWKPSTAVTTRSRSACEKWKSGIRAFSSQPRARSRSKTRGACTFMSNQSWRVCGMWMKPKSRR